MEFYDDFILQDYIRCEMVKEVKTLLDQGCDMDSKNAEEPFAALHVAADMGHTFFLKMLIEAGADINVRDYHSEETPLYYAKNLDTVKILVEAGADVSARSQFDEQALHKAARDDKLPIIEFLVTSCHADVNAKTGFGRTPLHLACNSSLSKKGLNLGTLKFFLKNNASINTFSIDGETPLITFLSNNFNKPMSKEIKIFLRFLLKYSDVNEGFFSYLKFMSRTEWFEIFFQHLAILELLGITFKSRHEIFNKKSYYDYFKKCTDELVLAKSTKICDTWVTFFNILTDDKTKLKNYAGNENLINNFKNFHNFYDKFPIYGVQMQDRVSKGIKRRELYDESCDLLCICLPIVNPTHLIIRDVLDNVSTKGLSKFCMK